MIKLHPHANQQKPGNQNIIKRFYFKQGKSSKINALKDAYQKIKLKKQLQLMEQKCEELEQDEFCKQISKRILQKKSVSFQTSYMQYKNEQMSSKYKLVLRNKSDGVIPRLENKRKPHSTSQIKNQLKRSHRVVSLGYCQRPSLNFNDEGKDEDLMRIQMNLSMLINKIKQKTQATPKFSAAESNWRRLNQIRYKHRNYTVGASEPALRIHGRQSASCRPWSTHHQKQRQSEMAHQPSK